VSWEYTGQGEKGFKIFRADRLIATVDKDTRSFLDTKLTPNTVYKYKIKVTDDEKFFTGEIKAYVPGLDFTKDNVYADIANAKTVPVKNTSELHAAIKNLTSYTTIILEDGLYTAVNATFPNYVHDVTIKARNMHQAKIVPLGWDDYSAFKLSVCDEESVCVHHINFIGLEAKGEGNSNNAYEAEVYNQNSDKLIQAFQFLKSPAGGKYNPSFIYFKNLKVHNMFQGIFSGVHAHDWTIDSCEMYNSEYSHMWYMMGWHQAVINSTFYNGSHDIIGIRGHYPLGETYTYIEDKDTTCHGNIYVKDRKAKNLTANLLSKDDWTHRIINNTFLSWKFTTPQRARGNTHIAIAYENYDSDAVCGNEQVYLPPQNIDISKNSFLNTGEHPDAVLYAIEIDARKGINNKADLGSVNGISIYENYFKTAHDNEDFITSNDDYTNTIGTDAYNVLLRQVQETNSIE